MRRDPVVWFTALALFFAGVVWSMASFAGLAPIKINLTIESGEWAAWVQAIGSLCAVCAAVYIASSQQRAQQALEISSQRIRIATLHSLCTSLQQVLEKENYFGSSLGYYVRRLENLSVSFNEIDILTLPSPELVEPVARLKLALNSYVGGFLPSWRDAKSNTEIIAGVMLESKADDYFSCMDSRRNVRTIKESAKELTELLSHHRGKCL